MFNVPKIKVKQIFFDGDSLFARGNSNLAQAYSAPLACYSAITGTKPPVFYVAVSGKTIAQLISDFPSKLVPYINSGDIVVFNELTNSLQALQNVTNTYNDLISYRDLVRALGAKIVVGTMTARGTGYATIETDRLLLNAMILSNSSQFDGVADVGGLTQFNSVAATANATYYDADTLHFATAGYTLYGQTFQPIIQPLI